MPGAGRKHGGAVFLAVLAVVACTANAMPNGTGNTVMFAPYMLVPTAKVPETFLSFNFDWNLNVTRGDAWTNASFGWTLDLQDKRLRALAKALSPANLRIGGSDADSAVYNEEFPGGIECPADVVAKHQCLSPARWDETVAFADELDLRIVFTLNMMAGRCGRPSCGHNGTGPWDPSNARALLNYTSQKHANFSRHGFELGNELEFTLSPEQTADAFKTLRAMVNFFWPDPACRPRVIGPALNVRPDWLQLTLEQLAPGDLDAITYHMYPGYGRSLDLPSLLVEPGWLDFSHQVMEAMQRSVLATSAGRAAELWIGETAAAWASGTQGVCNGFISGFWWLDQLGRAASSGHGAMCRQCFVGGNYSMLDQLNGFRPNPDFWSAWVWRQLMGSTMLAITQVMPYEGDFQPQTRGYLSCTPPDAPGYQAGAVTLLYINTNPHNASILMYQQDRIFEQVPLKGNLKSVGNDENVWPPTPPPFAQLPRLEFVMSPGDVGEGMLSRTVFLNENLLDADFESAQPLPSLVAMAVHGTTENWVVPARSYGFAVYPDAAAPACMPQ